MAQTSLICSVTNFTNKRVFLSSLFIALMFTLILAVNVFSILTAALIGIALFSLSFCISKLTQKTITVCTDSIEIHYPYFPLANTRILTEIIDEVRFTTNSTPEITLFWTENNKKHRSNLPHTRSLAKALKFWHNHGISVKNLDRDHELHLYITGQIDEYPMKNEV